MVNEQMQLLYEQLLLDIENFRIASNDPAEQAKSALRIIEQRLVELEDLEELEEPGADRCIADLQGSGHYLDRIYGLKFYYKELIWMMCNKPVLSNQELKLFYLQEVDFVQHYFTRHAAQYQRHRILMMDLELSDLPAEFQLDWSCLLADDEGFFGEDGMIARFIGYEHLLEDLFDRIRLLEVLDGATARTPSGQALVWTGKIVNLVELAYGIYETGQVNNGQATLADVLRCLQVCFRVNVKGPYRMYQDMMWRKTISPVEFLDQMRAAVLNRLDADLTYKA